MQVFAWPDSNTSPRVTISILGHVVVSQTGIVQVPYATVTAKYVRALSNDRVSVHPWASNDRLSVHPWASNERVSVHPWLTTTCPKILIVTLGDVLESGHAKNCINLTCSV